MPVSETEKRMGMNPPVDCKRCARTLISPSLVNLMALPARLMRICRKRVGSPRRTSGTSPCRAQVTSKFFCWARTARGSNTLSMQSRSEKGTLSRSSRPASIFEKSRMSLMIPSKDSAEDATLPKFFDYGTVFRMHRVRPAFTHRMFCGATSHLFPTFVGVKDFAVSIGIKNSNRRRRTQGAEELLTFPQSPLCFQAPTDVLVERQHILFSALQRQRYRMQLHVHQVSTLLPAFCCFVDETFFHILQPFIHLLPAET